MSEGNDLLIEAPAEPCRHSLGGFGGASQRNVEFCAALKFSDIARPLIDCLAVFERYLMMGESAAASGRANSPSLCNVFGENLTCGEHSAVGL